MPVERDKIIRTPPLKYSRVECIDRVGIGPEISCQRPRALKPIVAMTQIVLSPATQRAGHRKHEGCRSSCTAQTQHLRQLVCQAPPPTSSRNRSAMGSPHAQQVRCSVWNSASKWRGVKLNNRNKNDRFGGYKLNS
ncbi:unnamed protein product, partial [Iphiclides podalirius]